MRAPPTDVESNYGMTEETLLRHVPIPEGQVHRIAGEKGPEREAKDYCGLSARGASFDGEYPIFDVVILGWETTDIPPRSSPIRWSFLETDQPYAVGVSPRGQKRVAMTGAHDPGGEEAPLPCYGTEEGTDPTGYQIAQRPEADRYPATYIFRHRSDVELYTRREALGKEAGGGDLVLARPKLPV